MAGARRETGFAAAKFRLAAAIVCMMKRLFTPATTLFTDICIRPMQLLLFSMGDEPSLANRLCVSTMGAD